MANNAFDRLNFGLRERPLSADYNRQASQADRSLRDLMMSLLSARSLSSATGVPYTGFIGDGFRCVPTSPVGLSVQLQPGIGFFYDPVNVPVDIGATDFAGIDDRSPYKPMIISTPQIFAVPTAPGAGQSRIDIIEVRYDRRLEDAQTRRQLDPGTKSFQDHVFLKTLALNLDGRTGFVSNPAPSTVAISYKVGAAAATGSEAEPSTTAGYVKVARINVGPTVTTINSNVLVDRRPLVAPGGALRFGGIWRIQWNGGSPIHTAVTIDAPPGIQLGIAPLIGGAARGSCDFYAVGGQILHGSVTMTAAPTTVLPDQLAFGIQTPVLATGVPIQTVNSVANTLPAQFLAATPVLTGGDGTSVLVGRIQSRHVTNTGTVTNTNSFIEDVVVHVAGTLSYA